MEKTTLSFLICVGSEMFHAEFQVLTFLSTGSEPHPDLADLGMGKRLSPRTKPLSSWENCELCLSHPSHWELRSSRGTAGLNINIFMSLLCLGQNWSGQSTGWAQGNWTIKGNSRTEREKSSSWSVDVKFRALVAVTVTHLVTGLM